MSYQPLSGWLSDLQPKYFLVFYKNDLIVPEQGVLWLEKPDFFYGNDNGLDLLVTGYWFDCPVAVIEVDRVPDQGQAASVRSVLMSSGQDVFMLLSHAIQLRASRKSHKYCGCCGSSNSPAPEEWAMACSRCNNRAYPRISPCIITLVTRNDEILLVQHHRHGKASAMHTIIAGFVEPGENVEDAVHREVKEEVGITLSTVHYQFSQSWPFPHSLMLGFHAEYASGELQLEEKELSAGGWFKFSDLPELPPKFTISRQLIDNYLKSQ